MGLKKHVLPDLVQAGKTVDWQTFNWVDPNDTDMVWINGVEYLRVGMLEVTEMLTPEEHQDKLVDWSAILGAAPQGWLRSGLILVVLQWSATTPQ